MHQRLWGDQRHTASGFAIKKGRASEGHGQGQDFYQAGAVGASCTTILYLMSLMTLFLSLTLAVLAGHPRFLDAF